MKSLQDSINQVLQSLPRQALQTLIEKQLKAQGIKLSPRQLKMLTENFWNGEERVCIKPWRFWEHKDVTLQFNEEDVKQMEERMEAFAEKQMPALLEALTEEYSRKTLSTLKRKWPAESRLQRKQLYEFRKRLFEHWHKPLEALRMLVTISRELGDSIGREAGGELSSSPQKHLNQVLRALHARACQITEEIICLLEGGFADGAMARWRTLHEVTVVAIFLAEHGEEAAERYVLHQHVESRKASIKYQYCQQRLGYEPLLPDQVAEIERAYDQVVLRFGDAFKEQYGWAAHHLGKGKPKFIDIEAAADKAHLQAHYQLASHNVHANPKGVFFKLGLFDEGQAILLAGPSPTFASLNE